MSLFMSLYVFHIKVSNLRKEMTRLIRIKDKVVVLSRWRTQFPPSKGAKGHQHAHSVSYGKKIIVVVFFHSLIIRRKANIITGETPRKQKINHYIKMSFSKSSQQLSTNNTASALNHEMHSPSLTEIFQESFERSVFQGVSSTPPTWNQSRVPRSVSRQDLRSIIDDALAIIDDVEDLANGTF